MTDEFVNRAGLAERVRHRAMEFVEDAIHTG